MIKDPSAFARGLLFGLAWLIWLAGGYAYLRLQGVALNQLSPTDKIGLGVWALVSTGLLGYALALTIRGLAGQSRRPRG